jgi:hypothetical protein
MNYFNKFPTVVYDGQLAKNLLARAKLSDETRNNKIVFQKYTMNDLDRVDVLSNYYYDNPGYSWLVWFSNDVIDPYYDMPLSELDFTRYVENKYGSMANAMRKIMFYRLNWVNLDEVLTPQQFNALGKNKKYYRPVLDANLIPVQYVINEKDYVVSTNRVQSYTLDNITGAFVPGEEIQIDGATYAIVDAVGDDYVICKNIVGAFEVDSIIVGQTSSAEARIALVNTLVENIPLDETVYWAPVSAFDYENELNELKKEIKLLDVRYRSQAEADLKRLMSS